MSLTELEFYKCKLCDIKLIAGKYCIGCAKKDKVDKALNTKSKSPGYPFIDATLTSDYGYQDFTGTSTGTCVGTTTVDQPIWTNFTVAGNATNIDLGTTAAFTSGSVMDLGFGTRPGYRQNSVQSKRKKNRHK